ncbi:hypothetical protein [Providencia alcalifaciens]|uniref:hypothetical protein n=1 Tax=Providencia alcalifaciens TaxID=126385 RepID=UPI000DA02E36|nr:hypothetical protein [Providencia alcalifaciens]MTC27963.1 hypothetical protein [Providencia alcalifaciens]SPY71495.1 Uncharacterised protein [Providencia alcalifaciens]
MDTTKNIKITCKPETLETYFFQMMFKDGNDGFAKAMGIHPSSASREKSRIFSLACKAIACYGLPTEAVSMPEKSRSVVIEGDYAERLIQVLEGKGKVKRKASNMGHSEAQIELI